jgi:DNA-binding IclR family transcriptional regulator
MVSSTTGLNARRRSGAESSRKVLHLLTTFDEHRHTLSVPELAERTAMPVSSVYRYLTVLREEGLVEEAERGSYRLTHRVVSLAQAANAAVSDWVNTARPILVGIAESTGETALLIRRLGMSAVCVDRVDSIHPVRLQFDVGALMSLHAGSAARVLLAYLPRAERAAYFEEHGITQEGPLSDDHLDAVATAGWAESFNEVDNGIWGVSAAIHNGDTIIGAIGLAGPLFRLGEPERNQAVDLVRKGADEVGRALASRR